MSGTSEGHERHADSVGAYLLGALPELEAQAFERHVMGCAACRDEVERLRPAADALPRAAAPVTPPADLKRSVMAVVRKEAESPRERSLLSRAREALTVRPARLRPAMAWVSAAFLLAAGVAGGFGIANMVGEREPAIYTASVSSVAAPQGSASLEMDPGGEHGAVLSVSGMPTLPAEGSDRVYQLWLMKGGRIIPGAVFGVGAGGDGYGAITQSLAGVDKVLVTREKPGGAKAPTEDPIIAVELG
jgi:anti-sigma-K factor RskA